jgi:iron complex outermembrane receptor protein
MFSASLSHRHGDWSGDLRIFHNSGEARGLYQPGTTGNTITDFEMSGVRWKEALSPWQRGFLTFGIDSDWLSGEVDFDSVAPVPRQHLDTPTFRIVSPFVALSHDFHLGNWTLTPSAGMRYYDHGHLESATTPHAGVSLSSGPVKLFVNAARGINYPGLEAVVLSFNIPALGLSWRDLAPEKLNHLELGAQVFIGDATRVDVSLFRDEFRNRYVFGFPPMISPPPRFLNLGSYTTRGAELAVTRSFGENWSLFAAITLMDQSRDDLPYSPEEAATAGVNGRIGSVSLAVDAQYQARTLVMSRGRAAAASNTEEVGSFAVVNARLSHSLPVLGSAGEVFLAVENLFDRDYAYRPGYPMPGIGAQLGVSASF